MHIVWFVVAALVAVLLLAMLSGGGGSAAGGEDSPGPSGDPEFDEYLQADEQRERFDGEDP